MTDATPNNYGKNLPSNSHKSKEEAKPEKLEKVVDDGVSVSTRKRPIGRRFMDSFQGEDSRSVGYYIVFDVIMPAVKGMVADAVSGGIERLLYGGETRAPGARRSYGRVSSTNYNSVSTNRTNQPTQQPRRRDPRSVHDFDEVLVDNRGAAEEVIDSLTELIRDYGRATVSDFYDLVGITGSYTDDKWGWTSMVGARPERVGSQYLIALPRTESLT